MTTQPCKHLESLIRAEPSKSIRAYPVERIDSNYYDSGAGFIIPNEIKDRTWELQFRERLKKAGLEEVKIDILVLRFVYDMTFSQIADELSFLNTSSALRLYDDSIKHLKKIRFGKR